MFQMSGFVWGVTVPGGVVFWSLAVQFCLCCVLCFV